MTQTTSRQKLTRLSLLALFACGMLTCCCWQDSMLLDYWPALDASHEARKQAAAMGYRMGGFLGDFVTEPDAVGGCEVRIEFLDVSDDPPKRMVTVRLRRAWRLSGWDVIEMSAKDVP